MPASHEQSFPVQSQDDANAPIMEHADQSAEDARTEVLTVFASQLGWQLINGGHGSRTGRLPSDGQYSPGTAAALASGQLAQVLASGGVAGAKRIARYLYYDDSDPTEGAMLSFPSLDLQSDDGVGGPHSNGINASNLLPGVGSSYGNHSNNAYTGHPIPAPSSERNTDEGIMMPPPPAKPAATLMTGLKIPAMAASVFGSESESFAPKSMSVASNSYADSAVASSTPSAAATTSTAASNANASAAVLEQAAARNLGSRTTWTRSSFPQAPPAMLRSLASSFSSLVNSRVRAWTLLLLRHSLSSGDEESRNRLLSLLAASNTIDLTAIVTKFQTMKLPPEARRKVEEVKKLEQTAKEIDGTKHDQMDSKKKCHTENCDIVLPLIFEALVDVTIQGQQLTVQLRAPGTIAANFFESTIQLTFVEVKLDTSVLVNCMVEQARLVVFKAVAKAASLPTSDSGLGAHINSANFADSPLSQFGSALSLSQAAAAQQQQQQQAQSTSVEDKAGASALRLSSLMHGKPLSPKAHDGLYIPNTQNSALGDTRKQRSVTWNHLIEERKVDSSGLPSAKRPRLSQPATIMRSTKSFGKPDSSVFESLRNATFGEFGRSHKNSHVPTFVNGALQVPNTYYQPSSGMTPNLRETGMSVGNLVMGVSSSSRANATFHPSSSHGLRRSGIGNSGQEMLRPGSTVPRGNASFLLSRKPTFSHLSKDAIYSTLPPDSDGGSLQSSVMPRTATALESLLLSATKSKKC